ncbi:MAG: DNA primase [Alphaproteobacteria bacterium]|nr:DNA primase [Alphaproteobacteria bacterium]MBL6937433.1 DNA primase [Alphaproteobacteria bacterium]MBL7098771.1 DNA primase [Alphaproteobacteria bacterium]
MARFTPNLLDEILRRTDIVQLVGRRVKLTRKGQAFWGCCPFHQEKSPSFKVENARRNYKCFGCGKSGDAFRWLTETEGLSFPEAVERLASEAGVELPKWSAEDEEREDRKKSLYDIIEATCVFFEEQLRAKNGAEARDYLRSRALDGETAKKFRLGYAPTGNGTLIEHLKTKNITLDDMIAAGVVRPAQDDRSPRDFFFDRLMFPITDPRGRVIAFGGRGLSPDAKPKYINTGETTLFSKGHLLYNFATARPAGIKAQTIVVAEGYMDVIALVRAGFDYAVAPLGTALTEDQLHLLWRTAPEPVMAFDGDDAGLRAAQRAARLALPHLKAGHSLRFAFLPGGEDPDSFIRQNGPAPMKKILDEALPLSQVLWRVETEGKDFSTPERRAGLERNLAEIVQQIGDGKIADYYRRDFEQRVFDAFKRRQSPTGGQPRQWVPKEQYNRQRRGQGGGYRGPMQPQETVSPAVKASMLARSGRSGALRMKEAEIAALLMAQPALAHDHAELVAELPFTDRELDRFRHVLLNLAASGSSLEKQGFETHLSRLGMAELVARLTAKSTGGVDPAEADYQPPEDLDARFLKAASDLREMAERAPERARAMERFKTEGTEESWAEAQRLLGHPGNEQV